MTDASLRSTSPAISAIPARPVQLAVIAMDGTWRILMNGESVGRFTRQAEAVSCATDIAGSIGQDGYGVELLLQDAFGEVRSLSADRAGRAA